MNLKDFKEEFNARFDLYLDQEIKRFDKKSIYPNLKKYFSHIKKYCKEGKRIRPYMVYLGYYSSGKKISPEVWDAMIAVECFHVMALIHDDIIDKSKVRRGVDSVHYFIEKNQENKKDAYHYGVSQAILLGDLFLSMTHRIIFTNSFSKDVSEKLYELLQNVILGQMLDVDLAYEHNSSRNLISKKTKYKTALYTFAEPLQIGALLAKSSKVELDKFFTLGENLGIAYQLQDDLLDCISSEEVLGKARFGDIKERQQTLITYFMFNKASKEEHKTFLSLYGKKLNKKQEIQMNSLLENSGAYNFIKKEIKKYLDLSNDSLEKFEDKNKSKSYLQDIIKKLEVRTS